MERYKGETKLGVVFRPAQRKASRARKWANGGKTPEA